MKLAPAACVYLSVLRTGAVMPLNRLAPSLALAGLLLGAATATAQVAPTDPLTPPMPTVPIDAAERESVTFLLRAIHELPDAEAFAEVTARPTEVLWAIAFDEEEPAFIRDRAVLALGYWPDEQLWTFLSARAMSGSDELTTHQAIAQMVRVWPERSLAVVTPLLQDDDLQVRLSAIDALGRVEAADAVDSLERALDVEVNPVARQELERVLSLR